MKGWFSVLIFSASISTWASSTSSTSDLERSLIDRMTQTEQEMKSAPQDKKIAALADLKKFLTQREDDLNSGKNTSENRPYRFSLHGYSIYVNLLPDHAPSCAQCDQVGAKIQYYARPANGDPNNLQEEAKAALRLLQTLCPCKKP